MRQLRIPPDAVSDENSAELIRAWIANGKLTVSLHTGWHAVGEDTAELAWGWMLADVIFHIGRALSQKTGYPEEFIREQIKENLLSRLQNNPNKFKGGIVDDDPKQKA